MICEPEYPRDGLRVTDFARENLECPCMSSNRREPVDFRRREIEPDCIRRG